MRVDRENLPSEPAGFTSLAGQPHARIETLVISFVELERRLQAKKAFVGLGILFTFLALVFVPLLSQDRPERWMFFAAMGGILPMLAMVAFVYAHWERQHARSLGVTASEVAQLRVVWNSCVHGARSGEHIIERVIAKLH
ncbi:MAG: hypothetical protein Q8O67_20940 [Deltaproteobacteria bacterium]|nr:hypothetical protein [Deltaproteobacteria bacterium]